MRSLTHYSNDGDFLVGQGSTFWHPVHPWFPPGCGMMQDNMDAADTNLAPLYVSGPAEVRAGWPTTALDAESFGGDYAVDCPDGSDCTAPFRDRWYGHNHVTWVHRGGYGRDGAGSYTYTTLGWNQPNSWYWRQQRPERYGGDVLEHGGEPGLCKEFIVHRGRGSDVNHCSRDRPGGVAHHRRPYQRYEFIPTGYGARPWHDFVNMYPPGPYNPWPDEHRHCWRGNPGRGPYTCEAGLHGYSYIFWTGAVIDGWEPESTEAPDSPDWYGEGTRYCAVEADCHTYITAHHVNVGDTVEVGDDTVTLSTGETVKAEVGGVVEWVYPVGYYDDCPGRNPNCGDFPYETQRLQGERNVGDHYLTYEDEVTEGGDYSYYWRKCSRPLNVEIRVTSLPNFPEGLPIIHTGYPASHFATQPDTRPHYGEARPLAYTIYSPAVGDPVPFTSCFPHQASSTAAWENQPFSFSGGENGVGYFTFPIEGIAAPGPWTNGVLAKSIGIRLNDQNPWPYSCHIVVEFLDRTYVDINANQWKNTFNDQEPPYHWPDSTAYAPTIFPGASFPWSADDSIYGTGSPRRPMGPEDRPYSAEELLVRDWYASCYEPTFAIFQLRRPDQSIPPVLDEDHPNGARGDGPAPPYPCGDFDSV